MKLDLRAAILGAADGLVSLSGLVAAASAAGSHHLFVARMALAAAASGTVSMGNAQFASEGDTEWGSVGSMAAGTLAGAALPVLPLLVLAGFLGLGVVVAVAVVVAAVVGVVRQKVNKRSLRWNLLTTYIGLALGVGVGIAFGV